MDKEMLDIVNDLSKKPTTELALQIMELSGENLILEQKCKKQKEVIDKAIEYMKDFIFEPLLTNEDRKLIMYNDNLRNFEKILKEVSE